MVVNSKVFLDSNIIIYIGLVNQVSLRNWLQTRTLVVSAISLLEVLGYHKISPKDFRYFKSFFSECEVIPVQRDIIETAIIFRQQKRMSLGDSLIVATAFHHNLPLVTANTKDFTHISDLELINPIQL